MKKITITSLISILLILIISCNESTPICIDICHGNVIAIDNSSLEKLEGFTLAEVTTDKIIKFRTIGDVGITVTHMKEHMLIAEPVSVTFYINSEGEYMATIVADLLPLDNTFN